MIFPSLEEMALASFDAVRPPEQMTVAEAAEKYVIIRQPGAHVGPWSMEKTPYMREPMEVLTSLDHTGMVFVSPARTGKALALDTPIATPTGWTTMGEISVGDQVFDEAGTVVTVVAATEVMRDRECYRLHFSDGDSIVADAGHEWVVNDCHKPDRPILATTDSLYPTHLYGRQGRNRYSINLPGALDLPDVELPVHPYIFGAWLGDGTSSQPALTVGAQDIAETLRNLRACGVPVSATLRQNGSYYVSLSIMRKGKGCARVPGSVSAGLFSMDMGHANGHSLKSIPQQYLRASTEQRMDLLRGLLDTDGFADPRGQIDFCTTSPEIAAGMTELLNSLGYKFGLSKCPAAQKTAHRFCFFPRGEETLFRLYRKQFRLDYATKARRSLELSRRYIREIVPVESVPVRCIQVNGASSMYLAGRSMTPTHNSQIFLNWLAHTAKCDPTDMLLVHMAQHTAREWSKDDLEKMHRNSPEIGRLLRSGRSNDNTFDKEYLSGMRLTITWPTANNLSGKTKRYVWIMDYDRMHDSVDKEGNVFDLAKKRTQTFKRFGMTVAESSPGREVDNPKWMAKTPHEAPPTKGILELYNRGDRRRWQWQCLFCKAAFEPSFPMLNYPDSEDMMEAAEMVTLRCPSCGFDMEPEHKDQLNTTGRWVKDGMVWLPDQTIVARSDMVARRSDIASFWMKGPAAAFQDWSSLVLEYLRAEAAYEATGDEEPLRKTINTDQGEPYTPKSRMSERTPEDLKARAEDWGSEPERPTVPEGVRVLLATIDVQARAFVVQVQGFTATGDMVIIDGFKIRKADRLDNDGDPMSIDPAAFAEDWDTLIPQVIERTYELADGSGRRMKIRLTGCDSGGREGVTFNAYNFWRRLKLKGDGMHRRFALVKGDGTKSAPRTAVSWPDSNRRDKMAAAKGDVPVIRFHANLLKDQVAGMLSRRVSEDAEDTGGGMIRFPAWTPDWFYSQMTTEIRTAKGWENPGKRRNESFDLSYYALGLGIRPLDTTCPLVALNLSRIDWENPPGWAAEWDQNDMILWPPDSPAPENKSEKPRASFADLASQLA